MRLRFCSLWTLRVWAMRLLRAIFIWPSLFLGAVMLVTLFHQYQGGVPDRVAYYAHEAKRWHNVPEGYLRIHHCGASDNPTLAPLNRAEWQHLADQQSDCVRTVESFESVAQEDIRDIRALLIILLPFGLFTESVLIWCFSRAAGRSRSGEGRGGRAIYTNRKGGTHE